MRIVCITKVFPAHYESFVLNQLRGLDQRGAELDIIASRAAGHSRLLTPEDRRNLLPRTRYRPSIPARRAIRLVKAISLAVAEPASRATVLARAFTRRSPPNGMGPLRVFYEAIPCLKSPQSDIVFCQYGPLGNVALALQRLGVLRGKIVTAFRGYDLTRVVDRKEVDYQDLFREGALFLPVSKDFRQRLVALGCDPDKVVVQREGIDCSRFSFVPRCKAPGQPARLVTVARLTEKKGIEYVLGAVAQLKAADVPVDYSVIGDGPLRGTLAKLTESLGIDDRVHFLGWRDHDQVVSELHHCHILVQTSVKCSAGNEEGIPNVLKEAMCTGMPVIATRHAGIPELVEDGVTGYLVEERNSPGIADRVRCLICESDRWEQMGRAGRKRVLAEYDMQRLNDTLFQRFQDLASCS
jgi:colanic acid/amylovoran biosynthesis glycosyltransferase